MAAETFEDMFGPARGAAYEQQVRDGTLNQHSFNEVDTRVNAAIEMGLSPNTFLDPENQGELPLGTIEQNLIDFRAREERGNELRGIFRDAQSSLDSIFGGLEFSDRERELQQGQAFDTIRGEFNNLRSTSNMNRASRGFGSGGTMGGDAAFGLGSAEIGTRRDTELGLLKMQREINSGIAATQANLRSGLSTAEAQAIFNLGESDSQFRSDLAEIPIALQSAREERRLIEQEIERASQITLQDVFGVLIPPMLMASGANNLAMLATAGAPFLPSDPLNFGGGGGGLSRSNYRTNSAVL